MAVCAIFVFWTGFFAVLSARDWWERRRASLDSRLRRLFQPVTAEAAQDLLLHPEAFNGKGLQKTLALAGLKRKSDFKKMVLIKQICFALPLVLVTFLFLIGLPLIKIVIMSALVFLIFILIPRFWILRTIFKRRREIEKNLPDALDLFILCLEAGLSFDGALVRVAEETRRVSTHLSRELTSTHHEILAGRSREEALRNLGERAGVEDLKTLVGAILQSIKLGTSLVKTLRIQAEVIRKKRKERIRAEILKTPVKLIFPLLLFIFPTLLIVILAPSLVEVFRHLGEVSK